MEDKYFNCIELSESNGTGYIKIDEIELKGINKYEIKRDTDMVELIVSISVPTKNFNTTVNL